MFGVLLQQLVSKIRLDTTSSVWNYSLRPLVHSDTCIRDCCLLAIIYVCPSHWKSSAIGIISQNSL
jgi:hypothetical protein